MFAGTEFTLELGNSSNIRIKCLRFRVHYVFTIDGKCSNACRILFGNLATHLVILDSSHIKKLCGSDFHRPLGCHGYSQRLRLRPRRIGPLRTFRVNVAAQNSITFYVLAYPSTSPTMRMRLGTQLIPPFALRRAPYPHSSHRCHSAHGISKTLSGSGSLDISLALIGMPSFLNRP